MIFYARQKYNWYFCSSLSSKHSHFTALWTSPSWTMTIPYFRLWNHTIIMLIFLNIGKFLPVNSRKKEEEGKSEGIFSFPFHRDLSTFFFLFPSMPLPHRNIFGLLSWKVQRRCIVDFVGLIFSSISKVKWSNLPKEQ